MITLANNTTESALNVFAFFLVNYQHSPKLFHKVRKPFFSSFYFIINKTFKNFLSLKLFFILFFFSKMCSKLCILLDDLKKKKIIKQENSENNIQNDRTIATYNSLALLAYICITKFGGYPQLYKPLLDVIQVKI